MQSNTNANADDSEADNAEADNTGSSDANAFGDADHWFAAAGPLGRQLTGYAPRQGQIQLASAVQQAIQNNELLVAEAGTGTGKTFAYLFPVLASQQRAIVSTGTRALQDQLFHKDLPFVKKALASPAKLAMLKGRRNYLCLHRLTLAEQDAYSSERKVQLRQIRDFSIASKSGDVSEVEAVQEGDPVWPLVTSTAENCLGQECPQWDDCFVVKARREAQAADVVVVNHHLLFADLALKEEGFGEVLPGADVIVLDEAHQIPETAQQFFGTALTSRQVYSLVQDARLEHQQSSAYTPDFDKELDRLWTRMQDLRLQFGQNMRAMAWSRLPQRQRVDEALEEFSQQLLDVADALKPLEGNSRGLQKVSQRAQAMVTLLAAFQEHDREKKSAQEAEAKKGADGDSTEHVRWVETRGRGLALRITPLHIGPRMRSVLASYPVTWVMTSATLSTAGDFKYFQQQTGLQPDHHLQVDSPFDYQNNALLYLPKGLPDPREPYHTDAFVKAALPVLAASQGRAFLLFTSYRALNRAAALLENSPYNLHVQGTLPKQKLLENFRVGGSNVLLGTTSFWEGVDVRGEALSAVLIDKLPFAAPDGPVIQARLDAIKKAGGNSFSDYSVPQAVLTLKQGVGRLIRDVSDKGVLMIGDPRLITKNYGKTFLQSLPNWPVTHDLADVEAFFTEL